MELRCSRFYSDASALGSGVMASSLPECCMSYVELEIGHSKPKNTALAWGRFIFVFSKRWLLYLIWTLISPFCLLLWKHSSPIFFNFDWIWWSLISGHLAVNTDSIYNSKKVSLRSALFTKKDPGIGWPREPTTLAHTTTLPLRLVDTIYGWHNTRGRYYDEVASPFEVLKEALANTLSHSTSSLPTMCSCFQWCTG
jgi:hypothetical protein